MKSKKKVLLDDSSSSAAESDDDDEASSSSSENEDPSTSNKIQINRKYATEYQSRKQREELTTVRQMGGTNYYSDDNDSSSDESEDEDADLLTPAVDVSILQTINALRNKDERIYDPSNRFFTEPDSDNDDNEDNKTNDDSKRHKPKRFKDVIREQILQQMKDEENDNDNAGSDRDHNNASKKSKRNANDREAMSKLEYDEEQKKIRSDFLGSTEDAEDDDDLMVVKKSGKQLDNYNQVAEEMRQKELSSLEEKIGTSKDEKLEDPHGEVTDGEKFLLDFIKNKKWIDKTEHAENDSDGDVVDHSDDSIAQVEKSDDFESTYNFRFEEAAAAAAEGVSGADHSVIAYARSNTVNTLRRKDDTRRLKRLERKERKILERKRKEEQLRRLKNAKREEMEAKLKQIQSVLGDVEGPEGEMMDEAVMMKLVEGDYDPEKFEEVMKEAYGDVFYEQKDIEWKNDGDVRESLQKDEDGNVLVGEDDVDGGLYDNYNDEDEDNNEPSGEEGGEEEADEHYMEDDDDNEGAFAVDNNEETETEKKIKSKMMDELYKLDYEDIVAGMPTRFKYRCVESNNYGLNTEEILFARDDTLKQFVSLKKMAPYEDGGEYFVNPKKRRRFREMLSNDIEEEMEKEHGKKSPEDEDNLEAATTEEEMPKKKRRRQKKGKKNNKKESDESEANANSKEKLEADVSSDKNDKDENNTTSTGSKQKRKKKGIKQANNLTVEEKQEEVDKFPKKIETEIDIFEPTSSTEKPKNSNSIEKEDQKKKKKRKKKSKVEGVSASRLASYGL